MILEKYPPEVLRNEDSDQNLVLNQRDISNSLKQSAESNVGERINHPTDIDKNDVKKGIVKRQMPQELTLTEKEIDEHRHHHVKGAINFN
ncbi:unnamed protein product, partial [Onchocerca flexuosa]|uniref:Uncharacterized protein n=1 Tax=Onchocerca flexuosa TaxID=387005 RepID=A0A183HXB5_9BILA